MVTRMLSPASPSSLQLMMREMAHPTAACVQVVRDYIGPIAQKLGGVLAELLPRVSDRQRFLVAFSIVGQCLFYRNHRAVASLLVGEEEFGHYDVELVAEHIVSFTLRALGLDERPPSPSPQVSRPVQGVKP